MLRWETIDKNAFAVFIRDLSVGTNVNLKHMIEDMEKVDKKKNTDKVIKKKNVKMKKKDIIIKEQDERRIKKVLEDENEMIKYMVKNINHENIYVNLQKLSMDESKLSYKCELMKNFRKRMKNKDTEYNNDLFNLYYDLSNRYDTLEPEYKVIVDKLRKTLSKYDTKNYMLENLGHLMPPLNVWDKPTLKLEGWQEEVIHMIKHKKSVLVRAPTSSGKTFIAMSTGILHKRVLYICPAKPVAYQVGANYIKMGYKVHFLVDNCDHMRYDTTTNIFVGVPNKIEDHLPNLVSTINFDYVVYDEIHVADKMREYENILKMLKVPYLALSATIGNTQSLRNTLMKYNGIKSEYIEYNKRFINQQRWIYNKDKKLEKLHPCSCYSADPNEKQSIENISFTPYDCQNLYEKLEEYEEYEEYEEIDKLDPDKYFQEEKMISLDEVKVYEAEIKAKLDYLHEKYPEKTNNLMKKYKVDIMEGDVNDSLLDLLLECKRNDLLPALYFQVKEENAKEIFKHLYKELEHREIDLYPYHYKILEKKDKEYNESLLRTDVYRSSIKVKTKDARAEIEERLDNFKKKEIMNYQNKIQVYYETCISKCEKDYQKTNLQKELTEFMRYPDYRRQDIYRKHKTMCFTRGEPMSGVEIKAIRKELKESTGVNICYTSELFQLLKRGVGIYIESMPDKYNWIIQKLMSEKKLGVVITDRTLCLGIDLPIRTTILSGYKGTEYTLNDYLQMSGRAGRRGHDNQGNIVFHGVNNYEKLMKNIYPILSFKDKKYDNYSILNSPYLNTELIYDNKCEKFENKRYNKLLWLLRYYDTSYEWINNIDKSEREIFKNHKEDPEEYVLRMIEKLTGLNIVDDYNMNNREEIGKIKVVGELSREIYNHLCEELHMLLRRGLLKIFTNCKESVHRHQLELS